VGARPARGRSNVDSSAGKRPSKRWSLCFGVRSSRPIRSDRIWVLTAV